jgi:hypothetical protein
MVQQNDGAVVVYVSDYAADCLVNLTRRLLDVPLVARNLVA